MTGDELHLLIGRAVMSPSVTEPPRLEGCRYDFLKGMWMIEEGQDEVILVRSGDPKKPTPMTKKADRETGEDQKGT